MEGGRVHEHDSSKMTSVLLKSEKLSCSSKVLDSVWIPNSSTSFHVSGTTSMVNLDFRGENATEMPFFTQIDKEEHSNEDYDACFRQPEKKRRLLPDQVKFLEESFEVENKLEPERKVQLAKELGLQPRQVAIWYQNRRARYKTKQLEKDYGSLTAAYDKLKADYDSLFQENERLKNEVHLQTEKLKGKPKSEACNPTSPLEPKKQLLSSVLPNASNVPMVVCKQEDATCAKSGVFDSDSPHYTDGNHSSHIFEADPSDFSQDEDDNLSRNLLIFPKLEDECYRDLQQNSCNLGFPVDDQATWFWA